MNRSKLRHSFQREKYIARCQEEGREPDPAYVAIYNSAIERDLEHENDEQWKKNNLEYDLRSTDWICAKAKADSKYAQNIYAALCNTEWQKNDVWPIVQDQRWSCTWRYAGGIVADMREEGDYIDWYCSGIGDGLGNGDQDGSKGYVGEGTVTEQIKADLFALGWILVTDHDS